MFRGASLVRSLQRQPRQAFFFNRCFSVGFMKSHEWVKMDGDVATIGITKFAQDALGEVVFVDSPDVGATFGEKETVTTLESVKAVGEVYAPAALEIVEANGKLGDTPSLVNEGAEDDGWLIKAKFTGDKPKLMTREEYDAYTASLGDDH
jgi:glycine cleavage system H protein